MSISDEHSRIISEKDKQVFSKLDEIETEMKRMSLWSDNPPAFTVSNYLEAPSFELWLQCIFIPHAREAARKGQYPERSQVGLMAMRQYNYHSFLEKAQPLLGLLSQFDKIIEGK
ncbi:MAG: YqcC family protein [Candidatus Aegiribacteria sp.]|nr:YqcC family protein [Candidatus Aegiribacteria sp.]